MSLRLLDEVKRLLDEKNRNKKEDEEKLKLSGSQESKIRDLERRLDDFEDAYRRFQGIKGELDVDFDGIRDDIQDELSKIVK